MKENLEKKIFQRKKCFLYFQLNENEDEDGKTGLPEMIQKNFNL